MGLFDSLFTNKDSVNAATAANAGIDEGWGRAKKFIGKGIDAYNQYAGQASAKFDPLYAGGLKGYNAYSDATGVNGPEGNARAVDNFQTGPGYQFQLDQGLQALDRGAASRGMLSSGNLLQAEQKYGSDLANQEWQNYIKNLAPFLNQSQQAATSQAAILTGQGDTGYKGNAVLAGKGYDAAVAQGQNTAAAHLANQQASQNIFGAITSGLNLAGKVIGLA